MFARLVIVRCQPGQQSTFTERACVTLRYYREQPGCRGVHLLQSRDDRTRLIALSLWEREIDVLQARERPEYQDTIAGVVATYAEPQSAGEWDIVEI